ncbi:zinc-binding alcohol dehydrogenase family protein [Thiomicrorhabdus sediminis]|uniref:Zinc-type alcohol dehydrogenase-like protein n=1 Tax=Thiomicrorhabdus sediminis TaxID=2580412 RepID=A0A4P9K6V2_9GAMM|nr:zinc-binding alcohol dehydrogenase family protein [Thiomicrorhabdus sediminis]QCU90611.1 zinc-binding alcohol dehydrogenase family protein [Thiomicrorhabdus sediminis]
MQQFVVDIENKDFNFKVEPLALDVMTANDLLVRPLAVAVNPVDTKLYQNALNQAQQNKVLGYDAVAEVVAMGDQVNGFQVGDKVFYAGDMTRSGSFADQQLIDWQLVGKAPSKLSLTQSAAFPLVSITAYEALFDKLSISENRVDNRNKSLLIIGGAGGVGSIAIQLAKRVGLQVIATASRESSKKWCLAMGADKVIDHYQPLKAQLEKAIQAEVDYILCAADSDTHMQNMAESIKPFGEICLLVSTGKETDLNVFKNKSVSIHWEFMFSRSLYQTKDRFLQGQILTKIATIIDQQEFQPIDSQQLTGLNANNLKIALARIAKGDMCGKLVIEC